VEKSASIRQVASQRGASFPLSLRKLTGALPPGRVLKKTIPLDFLQRKFDVFINQRSRPLFQIRLDSKEKKFGQSTLTVAMDDLKGYDHDHPKVSKELAGPGERLSFDVGVGPLSVTYYYYFQDLKSDALTLNVVGAQSTGIEIGIHFETEGGIEMKVDGHTGHDIDFDGFRIKLNFGFGVHNGLIDLVGFVDTFNPKDVNLDRLKQFVDTDVSVNVDYFPDGVVASRVENTINRKIFEALNTPENRDALNKMVTRWLVGGDFYVFNVSTVNGSLNIDYILPPDQLEPFPENPQPPLDPGLLANIDHIVVLMMENRSFDHMLGYLSKEGGRSNIDGLRGGEKNSYKGRDYLSFPLADTQFNESPPHGHDPVENQIDGGKMDGFVAAFARQCEEQGVALDPGRIMGYHTADHVPVYDALARNFLICERWFAAHPGPTFCNRFYTLTGRLNRDSFGNFEFNNFTGDDFKPVLTRTIFDHLFDHGVSWHYYEHRYCTLRLYERYTTDDSFIVDANDPVNGFFASAQAGTLPSVSFIDPNFIDEPDGEDNDDGAPSNITAGQNLIGRVVNAVMRGPKWNKTLLIITYDEHGGFYDHVNPMDPRFRQTAKPVSGIDHYGVRVPAIVVSPWVDPGAVSDVIFDHTSIAKTIARRFMSANPPDMGERVAAASDLSQVMRSTPRQDIPDIPVPLPPPPKSAIARKAAAVADSDDFKEVLRMMRSRCPIRK
jgi:phospholipase C